MISSTGVKTKNPSILLPCKIGLWRYSNLLFYFQKMFIILAFNEKLIAYAVDRLHTIPVIGAKLEGPFKQALALQKEKLHRKSGTKSESAPLLGQIFEKLVLAMVAYFVVSILNSLAQSYHKRIHKETASASGKRKKSD